MQLASRIWFCWKWLAWGKDALGAVQHLLAFVGLSQGIAFDSSDDDDCKPRRVKSCRLKRPSVFKTWSCQVMLGPSPPCWAVVQDGWGSRRQRSCQAGLQAPWGMDAWTIGHNSISTTMLLKRRATLPCGRTSAKGRAPLKTIWKRRTPRAQTSIFGVTWSDGFSLFLGRPLKITKYSPWLRSRRPSRWRPWVQTGSYCEKIWKIPWWRIDGEKTLEDSMDRTWRPGETSIHLRAHVIPSAADEVPHLCIGEKTFLQDLTFSLLRQNWRFLPHSLGRQATRTPCQSQWS